MKKVTYNKLVGDGVPDKLTKLGKAFETRVAEEDEYRSLLLTKLAEEANEAGTAGDRSALLKELADLTEVVQTICSLHDITADELENMRNERRQTRGGFEKKIVLLWSEDDGYEAGKTTTSDQQ